MSWLTRWVLAHKRIVVVGWVALTIAGIVASGPASERLANEGSSRPLLPVVTLPDAETFGGVASGQLAAEPRGVFVEQSFPLLARRASFVVRSSYIACSVSPGHRG